MGSAPCSIVHPNKPEVHCNRPANKQHPEHSAYCWDEQKYVSWDNVNYEPTVTQRKAQTQRKTREESSKARNALHQIAQNIRAKQ